MLKIASAVVWSLQIATKIRHGIQPYANANAIKLIFVPMTTIGMKLYVYAFANKVNKLLRQEI